MTRDARCSRALQSRSRFLGARDGLGRDVAAGVAPGAGDWRGLGEARQLDEQPKRARQPRPPAGMVRFP